MLTRGGRSRSDRHQTMRATLDWSHQLFSPEEQIVFRRLAVFAGGFTLDAAEQVAEGDGVDRDEVADVVERLASKSLVAVDHERAEPRLHMLEPVRQYAAERLHEAGEHDRVVRRHLEWALSFAVKAGLGFQREQRIAGRSLSLERAADLALRVLDEELALAATPAGGGAETAGEAPPAPAAARSDDARVFRRERE
jgi:predicted ATPase